jgi:hypothetical protein
MDVGANVSPGSSNDSPTAEGPIMTDASQDNEPIAGNRLEPGKVSFVAVLLLLAGVVFLAIGINAFQQEAESRDWSSVEGRISSSQIFGRTTKRASAFSGHERTSDRYWAKVTYDFTVDGQAFRGERTSHSDLGYPLNEQAAEIVERYPEGKLVKVYYQSVNPENAVLEYGMGRAVSTPICFGVTLFLFSAVMGVVARVERKRESQSTSASSRP